MTPLEDEDDSVNEDDLVDEDYEDQLDDLRSDIGEMGVNLENDPNFRRSRWGNVVAKNPQDLYETLESAISLLNDTMAKGKVIYEPFNGGGDITSHSLDFK